MRLFPTPPYRDVPELLDSSEQFSERDIETTLRDIRRANIFGLGTWVVKNHLSQLLADHPRDVPVRVLDLATGSADIPQAICKWADTEGYDVQFVATDLSEPILRVAQQRITRIGLQSRVQFALCDASRPPFPDKSFDVVVCSLAFHHLTLPQARVALAQMSRLARKGFIVNDIYRSQGAWYMAWFLAHLTTGNKLTRHDGPASVMRAFTPAELRRMAKQAGVNVRVYKHPFWRAAVVGSDSD